MSAIFGYVGLDGRPAEADRLEQMRRRLAHRAPDGSRLFCQGPVGLGQAMLCTTPESLHETLSRIPLSFNSFTKRSWYSPFRRSTRPFACGE